MTQRIANIASKPTATPPLSALLRQSIREQLADGVPKGTIAVETGATLKQVDAIQAHITIAERKKKLTDKEMLRRAYRYALARARAKGMECLTHLDCEGLWEKRKGHCAISGVPFSNIVVNSKAKVLSRPWRPSLDRINPRKGYELRNVRLVAQIVNFGLGEWPLEVFLEMCRRVTTRQTSV